MSDAAGPITAAKPEPAATASGGPPANSCAVCCAAAVQGLVVGTIGGLVTGIIYGIVQEKLFVFRNVVKDYHLRDPPIRLFSVLRRGITTIPVAAAFLGIYSGSRCLWQHRLEPSNPAYAGLAASVAGAVRTAMGEVALHPLIHLQKSLGAGLGAAGLLAFVQLAEAERQREMAARQGGGPGAHLGQRLDEVGWQGSASPGVPRGERGQGAVS